MDIVDLLLIVLSLALPLTVIWWALNKQKSINNKVKNADISLLNDSGFTIKRVTQGPPGTQIYDDVAIITPPQR